jgi:hypothetical protein
MAHIEPSIDIGEYVRNSDFIFKGTVTEVAYKNSESVPLLDPTGAPVYEDGQPLYVDGSNLPHTFVTYSVEHIYKGSLPRLTTELILRFEGGQTDEPDPNLTLPGGEPAYTDFLMVTEIPLFDVNDRDFLFVKGNTESPCPLHNWARGRYRILDDPNNPTSVNMIYNEYGQQIRLVSETTGEPNVVILGEVQRIPEVLRHKMGQAELVDVYVDEGSEEEPNDVPVLPGVHANENEFGTYIAQVVQDECGTIDPADCGIEFISPDPNLPFYGLELTPTEPNEVEGPDTAFPRPWLDELDEETRADVLEQERVERDLFELTNSNPVLPETPCDFQILIDGRLIGDVSGPEGKPDCHVNLFDVAAVAGVWLECNDPEDETCFN